MLSVQGLAALMHPAVPDQVDRSRLLPLPESRLREELAAPLLVPCGPLPPAPQCCSTRVQPDGIGALPNRGGK